MRVADDLTVIVVGYRHERFVEATLASIEAQSWRPARVILCDDASDDRSAELMRAWAERTDLAVTLRLAEVNRGLTATLNGALAEVRTPFYTYISADDLMRPQRVERQLPVLRADPELAFVYCDAARIDESGRALPEAFSDLYRRIWNPPTDTYPMLMEGSWIPAVSVMCRTSCVRAVGGYDESLFFEDFDLWLRLASRWPFTHVDDPLVVFRDVSTSLGHSRFRDEDNGWHWAKVRMRGKHFGRDRATDVAVARIIRPWLITLLRRGESQAQLAPYFRRVARIDRSPASLVYAVASTLRLGRLLPPR
ncbi:MAG: glycosyltransferase [Tetrasphaera sp.]|nr:glycosyltransferase [Tetrasphaera sp.]